MVKVLFNFSQLEELLKTNVPDATTEIWVEQDQEDFSVMLVFALIKEGRRVTSKHRVMMINWLTIEEKAYKELMEAWNNNEDVLVSTSGRSSSIIIP